MSVLPVRAVVKKVLRPLRTIALRVLGESSYLKLRSGVLRVLAIWSNTPDPANAQASAHEAVLQSKTTFSIIVPIYNTPQQFLEQCLQSVYAQTYPNWELILVDDHSTAHHIAPLLGKAQEYAHRQDLLVKVIRRPENGNISQAVNDGMKAATGDYLTVLDHDDMLHPAALYWIVDALLMHPDADYLYSDEDKTNTKGRRFYGPFLKPGWSPELALQCMYSCHMSVYDRQKALEIGGMRSEFDGAQDYDFLLRFISRFDRIHHVNKLLYHWREWEQSTALSLDAKPEAFVRQRKALTSYLDGRHETYEIEDHPQLHGHHKVSFFPRRNDKISIIIPTANKVALVDGVQEHHIDGLVRSIVETSTYTNYEIIIVHDNTFSDAQLRNFENIVAVRLVSYDNSNGFNYSEKVNIGAAHATGDYFLLLNDDVRVITPNWLERMLGMAQRPGVGAVGAKLLFPSGKVQHCGIWIRGNVAGHIDYDTPRDTIGYDLCGTSNRSCIGVTAACQMSSRQTFEDLGGYLESFPLNYNDVDYCLRLHMKGLRSVCLNDVELYHYEGASRTGGQEVATDEIERFLELWRDRLPYDPYLPSNFLE